ncbi:MAG: hypothetical protein AABW64_02665 [Nanoarchaeota archaeon]
MYSWSIAGDRDEARHAILCSRQFGGGKLCEEGWEGVRRKVDSKSVRRLAATLRCVSWQQYRSCQPALA